MPAFYSASVSVCFVCEAAALGDLAIVYNNINQPRKTKDLYTQALHIAVLRKEAHSMFTNSTNLGSIYNKLGVKNNGILFGFIKIQHPVVKLFKRGSIRLCKGTLRYCKAQYNEQAGWFRHD